MVTPAMQLSALKASYAGHEGSVATVHRDLERAFALGHQFGIDRAAEVVDQCNREGPYNAIGAASRIRALVVKTVNPTNTTETDFL